MLRTGGKLAIALAIALLPAYVGADELSLTNADGGAAAAAAAPVEPAEPAPPDDPPPLPFHCIEGYSGGAITPLAYICNGDTCGECFWGKPTMAYSFVGLGRKNLDAITLTEPFLEGRFEFGYGADRLGLGTLPGTIQTATGVDVERSDVWMHNFNLRCLAVKENTEVGGIKMPAITLGVDFKYNADIEQINNKLGGALDGLGYRRSNGEDYTLTVTKMIPKTFGGRPLIITAGLRESQAANLGFLGFGDTWKTTFEGNVVYLVTDHVALAYEYRQKGAEFDTLPGVINGEDNWHAFDVGFILNKQTTLVAGYGIFGTLADSKADSAWWLQLKYEF